MSPEHLEFANGQRLDAGDLRLEQRYHVDMRRRLNRGLFTPGVVSGLEVTVVPGTRDVSVARGLALDPLGRELVLDQASTLTAPSRQANNQAGGYFLVLRYDEQRIAGAAHPCASNGATPQPARIAELPKLQWSEVWPDPRRCPETGEPTVDCGIVIALVLLDSSCNVAGVETAFRQYAYPVHLSTVQAVALEGEKDIDGANPKLLHFLVRGGTPTFAVLYLWGAKFSSLYYTELGRHSHDSSPVTVSSAQTSLASHTHSLREHTHPLPALGGSTDDQGSHAHRVYISRTDLGGGAYIVSNSTFGNRGYEWSRGDSNFLEDNGSHHHDLNITIPGPTGEPSVADTGPASSANPSEAHSHTLSGQTGSTGATGGASRAGAELSFLDDLRIAVDGVDVTGALLARYLPGWERDSALKLGDGSAGHPFNAAGGTGPLSLLDVGPELSDGMHTIKLSVGAGGGKVLYSLYIA
jgi:hypothetical protein